MSEYEALVYQKLRLDTTGHDIGTMRYIDLPASVLHAVCARRLNTVEPKLYADRPPRPTTPHAAYLEADRAWCRDVRTNVFLLYRDWLHVIKNIKSYEPQSWQFSHLDYPERRKAIVECHLKNDLYPERRYEPTFADWKRYLRDASPRFDAFLQGRIHLRIPESARREHTYVCGATGSGKTELLKLFIHSYIVNHPDTALIIIEPTSKLSTEVARFRENVGSDRIVYVTYERDRGLAPCINPLRISGVSPSDVSGRALDIKNAVADEVVEALGEMIRADGDMQFTVNMQNVLRSCLLVLFDKEGATLRDLVRFMNDGDNDYLVDFALTRSHDFDSVRYFQTKFKARDASISQTKGALFAKLSMLIIGRALAALTCREEQTIDLEKMIAERKIVIFNLSKGRFGPGQGPAFGRLIIAMLKSIAMRREELLERKIDPVPVHVFIDECHNYISASIKTIMREARKYKVILTLSQTEIGAEMPTDAKEAVLGGTNLKIAGAADDARAVARLLQVDDAEISRLPNTEFVIRPGRGKDPIRIKTHDHLIDERHSMSERQWEAVLRAQFNAYYTPVTAPASVPEIIPPTHVESIQRDLPSRTRKRRRMRAVAVDITEEEDIA